VAIDVASQSALLALARGAIVTELGGVAETVAPSPPIFEQRCGAFVTLMQRTRLRGCIGRIEPDTPLRTLIPDIACSAAFSDPRFAPVAARDLDSLVVEISLLSKLAAAVGPADVMVGQHGLLIVGRGRRGLLLPQVAVEHAWTAEEFLSQTCVKAGLDADAWRGDGVRLQTFTADVFSEEEK
jgi:AmmeMemoRadiSam system protein A